MGIIVKSSLFILLVAISTPLLYRHFATDETSKYMSKYYANFEVIDQFLKQTAGTMDQAKDYMPSEKQVQQFASDSKALINDFVSKSREKIDELRGKSRASDEKVEKTDGNKRPAKPDPSKIRMSSCPGESVRERVWSKEELSQYDGSKSGELVYLGFLGVVYNVTLNAQHYGPGGDYSIFAGRDATRAFITGNFTHDLYDDIRDLDETYYSHVDSWAQFYSSSYERLGKIEGAYFDSQGCETSELARVDMVISKLAKERAKQEEQSSSLPECNSEWNSDLGGGRVWCSKKSGGLERDWVGLPRSLVETNELSGGGRCVCVNPEAMDPNQVDKFKPYPDCDPRASECNLKA